MSRNLTLRQRRAVEALASGADWQESALAAGVSLRTVQRWRNQPAFVAGLQAADAENLAATARALNAAATNAIAILLRIMQNPDARDSVRLRAASEILKHRAAFYELKNLNERLEALEAVIREKKA